MLQLSSFEMNKLSFYSNRYKNRFTNLVYIAYSLPPTQNNENRTEAVEDIF